MKQKLLPMLSYFLVTLLCSTQILYAEPPKIKGDPPDQTQVSDETPISSRGEGEQEPTLYQPNESQNVSQVTPSVQQEVLSVDETSIPFSGERDQESTVHQTDESQDVSPVTPLLRTPRNPFIRRTDSSSHIVGEPNPNPFQVRPSFTSLVKPKQQLLFDMEQLQKLPSPEMAELEIKKIRESLSQEIDITDEVKIKHSAPENLIPRQFTNHTVNDDGKIMCKQPAFLRVPAVISGKNSDPEKRPKIFFRWLTISQSTVVFENLDIVGKIQVTARAKVIFKNCKIQNTDASESIVEIFASSSAVFEDCEMYCSGTKAKACVVVRDISHSYFNRCSIKGSPNTGILVLDTSFAQIVKCDFSNCGRFGVYPYRNSKIFVQDCIFHDMDGKGVFVVNKAEASVNGCSFNKCKSGGISLANESIVQANKCCFEDLDNSTVHAMKNSKIKVVECVSKKVNGNGVNCEDSTGEVADCHFDSHVFPAIFVSGLSSSPKITRCKIQENSGDNSVVAVRSNATPVFEDLHIGGKFNSELPVISCSDFCGPVFKGLSFEPSEEPAEVITFNGANVKIVLSPEPKLAVSCFPEDEPTEMCLVCDHPSVYNVSRHVRICERSFGRSFVTDDDALPERWDVNSFREQIAQQGGYRHPDMKLVAFPCGHCITSCPLCGNNEHDVFTSYKDGILMCKCGHRFNFNKNDADYDRFRCGLCKMKIQGITKIYDNCDDCILCLDKVPDTFFLPCGHKCVCYECAQECFEKMGRICPECLKPVFGFKYDFFTPKHK